MKEVPSATRIVLYILIISLAVLIFLTYKGDQFEKVFDLFKTVTVSVVAFFFGKSTQESLTRANIETNKQSTTSILEKNVVQPTQVDNLFELEK